MKFQLQGGGWPCGQYLIPADTIIDGDDPQWRGLTFPMNAKALDQEAADYLSTTYPHSLHELHAVKGVTIRKLINV